MTVFDVQAGAFMHYNVSWESATEPVEPNGGTTIDVEARAALTDLIEALRKIGIFSNAT